MKKVLIGCGIGCLVIILVMVGLATYFGLKLKQAIQPAIDVAASYDKTNQDYPFSEPANNAVTSERFTAYVNVRQSFMTDAVGNLKTTFEKLAALENQENASLGEGMKAIQDIFDAFVSLGEKHVALLNENKMSLEEYDYLTRVLHATIDKGAAQNPACAELKTIIEEAVNAPEIADRKDEIVGALPIQGIDYVESNGNLIAEHKDKLANPKEAFLADYFFAKISTEARSKMNQGK